VRACSQRRPRAEAQHRVPVPASDGIRVLRSSAGGPAAPRTASPRRALPVPRQLACNHNIAQTIMERGDGMGDVQQRA